jgi:hypothetical protein
LNLKLQELVEKLERKIPLGLNEYKSLHQKKWNTIKEIGELTEDSTITYQIINNGYDEDVINLYEEVAKENKKVRTKLQNDIYIEETYKVLNDLITK